jgi:Flp pilus assembly pilin Flp
MTLQAQRGQAMTEYVVVLLFVVVALVAATHPSSPVRDLVTAVKKAWAAYSYAISLSV